MADRKRDEAELAGHLAELARLSAALAGTAFIWPGTVQRRLLTCGKPECACHTDPASRHGPYPYWTSKKAQKTVSRLLAGAEADLLEEWIENRRRLERVVEQIKRLSRKALKPALRLRTREEGEATGST